MSNSLMKSIGTTLSKNSPTILTVGGVIGFGVCVVLASRATLKAQKVLADHNERRDNFIEEHAEEIAKGNKEYTMELAKVYSQTIRSMTKLYLPAVIVGVASVSAILGGHHILSERNVKLTNTLAATTAAYNKLDDFMKQYRKRVVDTEGELKDKEYAYGTSSDKVDTVDADGKKTKLGKEDIHTKDGVTLDDICELEKTNPYVAVFAEGKSKEYVNSSASNMTFLKAQQNYWNDVLHSRATDGDGVVMLNEVRQSLGLKPTAEGAVLGWSMRADDSDRYISFGITDLKYPQNELFLNGYKAACILEFNCDGVVYKDIGKKMPLEFMEK